VLKRSVAVLGLLLATSCGGSDEHPAQDRLTKANISQRMTDAMAAKGSMHLEMSIDAGAQKITMVGDQVLGKDAESTKMSIEYSESGEDALRMRLVDGIVYANLGNSSNNKYVRFDPADPTSRMGQSFAPLLDELDLSTSIRQFKDAIIDVEEDGGQKKIDGVRTMPYRVTIDVDRAVKSGALDKDSGLMAGTSVEYTFYIDDQDLLRRMEFTVGAAKARMNVTNLGEPIRITAPPADQVIEESTFMDAA
jgi:hypothetical protein